MKKLVYLFLILLLCSTSCHYKANQDKHSNDSIVKVFSCKGTLKVPLDSFLRIKDSLVFCEEESLWMTKELYKWNYGYPDTIVVAFTRNGVFEDSIKAFRWGIVYDSLGNAYSPAYMHLSVVGDNWIYDINGKFVEFNCSDFPHSGAPHDYKP